MKKLTTSVLAVVLSSSFAMVSAQETQNDTTNIREVVVTGAMGIKKRQDAVTSSNKVVAASEITQAANPNAAAALTGKVAGLFISNTNSSVNPTMRINLRGNRTITGSTEPLVVIDGVASNMTLFQQLPPEIIESVNVVKGPQGSALYGPKGSNGAIIVTTKKGAKSEKIAFSLNSSVDISSIYKLPIYQTKYGQGWPGSTGINVDGTTFVQYENSVWGPAYDGSLAGQLLPQGLPQANNTFIMAKYAPIDEHLGLFFNNGVLTQNSLSMNIGGRDSYAFLTLNRTENDFIVAGDNMKRNSVNFKAGKKVGNFSIDGGVNIIDQNTKQTGANIWGNLIQTPTNVDVRRFSHGNANHGYTPYAYNPYWLRDNLRRTSNSTIINGLLGLNYQINDNISLTYNGNFLTQGTEGESWTNSFLAGKDEVVYNMPGTEFDGETIFTLGAREIASSYGKTMTKYWKYYGDIMANFNYDLNDDLNLKFAVGNNISDTKNEYMEVGGTNLEIPGWYHINNVLNVTPFSQLDMGNGRQRERSYAFFANLDLDYKGYLFLNATARWDKTSTFSVTPYETNVFQNKGYFYPSVGISFIPTKAFANFGGDVLNYMKLSASYTRTGNNGGIAPYAIDQTGLIPTGFPFAVGSYILPRAQYDVNLNPEFNNTLEGNISLGFFKDRITLEASAHQTKTSDLITKASTSTTSGISSLVTNIGDMTNKGYEVELGVTPFKSKDFEWKLTGSYTTYKSTVDALADGADEVALYTNSDYNVGIYAVKGQDMPVIKGTAYTRDPNGNIVVDEATGLPIVDSNYQILGKVNPDYILGFTTQLRYKNLTLSAVADYRTGNKFYSAMRSTFAFVGALEESANFDRTQGYIIPGSVVNTGSGYAPNTTPVLGDATYSNVVDYYGGVYGDIAENHVIDGSAFKIREIALSYKLPKDLLSSTFINSVTLGVYARNPFAWYAKSNRNYADPETALSSGAAGGFAAASQLPTTRTFGFNINFTF